MSIKIIDLVISNRDCWILGVVKPQLQLETFWINLIGILHFKLKNLGYHCKVSVIILKLDAANFMNVEGKIDNCDDLYSVDARNPVVNFLFETK